LDTALRRTVGDWRWPEIVEMIWAIAGGSEMAPGEGWFHPGQSRYGWNWLASRYDTDKNGRITREEFQGPAELFDQLDRDHDGALTADDLDWSDRSPFLRQVGATGQWFRCIDANSNGRLSLEEWEAFFKRAAKGKNHLTREDLREALNPPLPAQSGPDEPSPLVLVLGLLTGELGSLWEGPRINQKAPDFSLETQDGKRRVRLSDFLGQKPVVLVFGSFT
jgi:Ca2+-binding EF-hand superfamily protein